LLNRVSKKIESETTESINAASETSQEFTKKRSMALANQN